MATNQEFKLIKKVLSGDKQSFSQLIDLHKNLVFSLALRMLKNNEEAEEIAQDTFLKVYTSLASFNGDSKFSTWIYRIAYNSCLDRLKKRKLAFEQFDGLTANQIKDMHSIFDTLVKKERAAIVESCIQRLPTEDAAILTLFYFEEKNLKELEKIMNVPVNTLKVRLHRARKKLAEILSQHVEFEIYKNHG